jgi:hypothetical protein
VYEAPPLLSWDSTGKFTSTSATMPESVGIFTIRDWKVYNQKGEEMPDSFLQERCNELLARYSSVTRRT